METINFELVELRKIRSILDKLIKLKEEHQHAENNADAPKTISTSGKDLVKALFDGKRLGKAALFHAAVAKRAVGETLSQLRNSFPQEMLKGRNYPLIATQEEVDNFSENIQNRYELRKPITTADDHVVYTWKGWGKYNENANHGMADFEELVDLLTNHMGYDVQLVH